MKVLIAVVTCHTRRDWADAVRSTWVRLVEGADVKFFLGRGEAASSDEIILNCDDSYQGLPEKVREIVRWAAKNDYDYLLKCDDDVVLHPAKLLASDFVEYDFTSHESEAGNPVPWGFNYWLSRKSMSIMATEPLPFNNNDESWVAHTLLNKGITLHHDGRYWLYSAKRLELVHSKRPLRAPYNNQPNLRMYFSWCMHNKLVPRKALIEEFKRVFKEEVDSACQDQHATPHPVSARAPH